MFTSVALKSSLASARVTSDNIYDLAAEMNGTVVEGILDFSVSGFDWLAWEGDWILRYSTGDVQVITDKMFNRLYMAV